MQAGVFEQKVGGLDAYGALNAIEFNKRVKRAWLFSGF